jgi:rhodanese-related sulfurtransferase
MKHVVLEAFLIAITAAAAGLAINALRDGGLAIHKDYFLAATRPADEPPPPPPPAGATPEAVEAEVSARLVEAGFQVVSDAEAAAMHADELFGYEAYVFLDARNLAVYGEGHIPGAWFIDPYRIEDYVTSVIENVRSAVKIVVYCNGGQCSDSEIAAQHLLAHGVSREAVFVYVGGIEAWKRAGRPLERGARGSGDLVTVSTDGRR